jgi:hypothetical protein
LQTFCTIITESHLPYAKVLASSLLQNGKRRNLQVLIIDGPRTNQKNDIDGITFYSISQLAQTSVFEDIYLKYAYTNTEHFRWALKPVFISYLLANGFDKVIYTDADMFFTNNYEFLFEELEFHTILLSPHWRNISPAADKENFYALFKDGQFNAGFIGCNSKGTNVMSWWAEVCHFEMDKRIENGLYDDQRFLDALPVYFEGVKILEHKGCNIACWNISECRRTYVNQKLLINEKYPVIFIHFTEQTIANIISGADPLLKNYLDNYLYSLTENGLNNIQIHYASKYSSFNFLVRLKKKTLLRTRLKKFLHSITERL